MRNSPHWSKTCPRRFSLLFFPRRTGYLTWRVRWRSLWRKLWRRKSRNLRSRDCSSFTYPWPLHAVLPLGESARDSSSPLAGCKWFYHSQTVCHGVSQCGHQSRVVCIAELQNRPNSDFLCIRCTSRPSTVEARRAGPVNLLPNLQDANQLRTFSSHASHADNKL